MSVKKKVKAKKQKAKLDKPVKGVIQQEFEDLKEQVDDLEERVYKLENPEPAEVPEEETQESAAPGDQAHLPEAEEPEE